MTQQPLQALARALASVRAASQHLQTAARRPALLLTGFVALGASLANAAAPPHAAPAAAHVDRDFGKVPLSFEPNQGQTDARVQFLSRGHGYSLFLTPGEAVLELQKSAGKKADAAKALPAPSVLRMMLVGADAKAAVSGEQQLTGTANYFMGNDSSKWKTAVPTYQRVAYSAVYPGVDLVYYGNQRQLEYDFVVAPGADAAKIALQFTGATPKIDKAGDLVLAVQGEEARFHKPVVYQLEGDRRISVAGSYQIADGKVGFSLGAYDHTKALVIDPILSYLTYIGGSNVDTVTGMAVDAQGNAIVTGTTFSTNFPLKNAYSSVPGKIGNYPYTMFVSKFNATGTALVYSTFLGDQTAAAVVGGVAVDPSGNAYVLATTNDPNYPVTPGAYQTLCGASFNQSTGARVTGCSLTVATGNNGMAVTKISPDGSQLVYSTFFGGSAGNRARAIAVNAAGEAYVIGAENALCQSGAPAYYCFPVTANAVDSGANGADTAMFLTKFNAQGTGLVYSTLLNNHNPVGHSVSGISPNAITLDAAGNAYVTGNMDSAYFITTTTGALQPNRVTGSQPAFVAKFNPAGTAATSLVYSTYLSGTDSSVDNATGIAVDSSGNAVVTGYTSSCTFPTTAGSFSNVPNGIPSNHYCNGGFLTKLNTTGSGLVWSTWTSNLGAAGGVNDANDAVALAADGSVYLTGDSNSSILYPTLNPILTQLESHFTYVKHFTADGKTLLLSSAVGGTTDATSIPAAIALDSSGNIYLAGSTNSLTWPVAAGGFQQSSAGGGDGFVVKIAPTSATTTALTLPTGTVTAGQSVKLSAKVTGQTGSTGTPTGVVTFLSGGTTLGTGTLDSTATATYTAASLNATTYSITASYAGDTAFSGSISAAQNLVVATVTPTVTLTAPSTAVLGASVTLSVVVAGTAGTPTGTVTFKDGTTTLSTATLASGAASYSTSTLAGGSHTITASYSGDSIFGAANSTASTVTINVARAISFAAQPTSLTVVHGSSGNVVITGTPVGGYTGTVTFACGTLPTGASCLFAPASLNFTGNNTAAATTLTFGTVTTVAALESLPGRKTMNPVFAAVLLLPLGFLSRRKLMRGGIVLSLLVLASVAGLGGCSSGTKSPTTVTTAAGSYTVPVTITAGTAVSTLNVSVVVQ